MDSLMCDQAVKTEIGPSSIGSPVGDRSSIEGNNNGQSNSYSNNPAPKIKRCKHGRIIVKDSSKKRTHLQNPKDNDNETKTENTSDSIKVAIEPNNDSSPRTNMQSARPSSHNSHDSPQMDKIQNSERTNFKTGVEIAETNRLDALSELPKSVESRAISDRARRLSPLRRRVSRSRSTSHPRRTGSNRSPSNRRSPKLEKSSSSSGRHRRDRTRSRSPRRSRRSRSKSNTRNNSRIRERNPRSPRQRRSNPRGRWSRRRDDHRKESRTNNATSPRSSKTQGRDRSPCWRRRTGSWSRSSSRGRSPVRNGDIKSSGSSRRHRSRTPNIDINPATKSLGELCQQSIERRSNSPDPPKKSESHVSSGNNRHGEINEPTQTRLPKVQNQSDLATGKKNDRPVLPSLEQPNRTPKDEPITCEGSPSRTASAPMSITSGSDISDSSDIYDPEGPVLPISPGDSPPISPIDDPIEDEPVAFRPTSPKNDDGLPSSAVQLNHQEKYLQKLNRQERVIEEVKLVLKPYYRKRSITKDQYKDVLRRLVPEICHFKNGEINPVRIRSLVKDVIKRMRKHK